MVKILAQVAQAKWFSNFIVGVILLAGFLVGLETYPSVVEGNKGLLHALDQIILWIFVVEVVIKMGAEGSKPWRYFRDPWNIFDFTIVAVCFLPVESSFVAVLRLARILRVLKVNRLPWTRHVLDNDKVGLKPHIVKVFGLHTGIVEASVVGIGAYVQVDPLAQLIGGAQRQS